VFDGIFCIHRQGRQTASLKCRNYFAFQPRIGFFTATAVRAVVVGFWPHGTHDYPRALRYSLISWEREREREKKVGGVVVRDTTVWRGV
jgi:hypothetical protein